MTCRGVRIALVHADRAHSRPDAIQISYSRSSGPGYVSRPAATVLTLPRGQNVNKVSTKATIRLTLSSTTSWLPRYTTSNLLRSQHHTAGTILINSSAHRTQPQNLADALAKMKGVILDAAREGLVGATSEGQKRKVEGLEERDRVRTMMQKKERKGVKSGRRDSGGDY